jgi:hypothetical protein
MRIRMKKKRQMMHMEHPNTDISKVRNPMMTLIGKVIPFFHPFICPFIFLALTSLGIWTT